MKFIHIADIHASRERKVETLKIIDTLINTVDKEAINAVLICGDFWDSTITNTMASGFPEIIHAMKKLISMTAVIMIYGTPSHEPDGSLDIFGEAGATIIPFDMNSLNVIPLKDINIIGLPEPRITAIHGDSVEDKIKAYHKHIADYAKEASGFSNIVVMYHGDIEGAELQNGLVIPNGNFALSKDELKAFNAEYIACGHVHKPQQVMNNCYYSGSACPKDFGETHEAIFKIVEI